MKLKTVFIKIADFRRLLDAASVVIENPSALREPEKSARSYLSSSEKSISLELSDRESGSIPFRMNLTLQYVEDDYVVIIDSKAQHTLHLHNVLSNPELL